jgi:hypothetical protein
MIAASSQLNVMQLILDDPVMQHLLSCYSGLSEHDIEMQYTLLKSSKKYRKMQIALANDKSISGSKSSLNSTMSDTSSRRVRFSD